MRSFVAVILPAYLALANGSEQNTVDDNALIDRALHMRADRADLDETTLAKPGVAAKPSNFVQVFPAAAPGMAGVHAMQEALQKQGIASSPFQKLALTQLAATRDPSMKAQVREVYESMPPADQDKLRKISKEVYVRATLEKEKMPGVTQPFGFWDPFNFAVTLPGADLYFYREAELKHGRTCMLAVLGIVFADKFHPWYTGDAPYASPVLSHYTPDMFKNFWPILALVCGAFELFTFPQDRSKEPGDLGFDPLGLKPKTEKDYLELHNKEINNGRLAMLAWAGIIGKELMTGEKVF